MIELGGHLPKFNEKLNVLSKGLFEMLEKWAKSENHATNIAQKITSNIHKVVLMKECMTEMNDPMTKLEQERNIPSSYTPSFT